MLRDNLFQRCTNLTRAILPPQADMEKEIFRECLSLTEVELPENIEVIPYGTFMGCCSLTHVNIPNGVAAIGDFAFQSCTELSKIALPDHCEEIGVYAFESCGALTELTIPSSIKKVGEKCFLGCTGLRRLIFSDGVEEVLDSFSNACDLDYLAIPKTMQNFWPQFHSVQELFFFPTGHANWIPARTAVLIAPNLPLSEIMTNRRKAAVLGFAKRFDDFSEERREEYFTYLQKQRKRLYPLAVQDKDLLQLMLRNNLIPKNEYDLLIQEAEKQGVDLSVFGIHLI